MSLASTLSRIIPRRKVDPQPLIDEIRAKNLTYCGFPKLENIAEAVQAVEAQKVPGVFLEAGVALGGSAILIARLKSPARTLTLYDVYEMIPPPGANDEQDAHARYEEIASGKSQGLGGGTYYGYQDDLYSTVRKNLADNGVDLSRDHVSLVKGLFEDTLKIAEPVAFAHVDCDWYDSVKVCLDRITPHMSRGATIIFDDYSSYSGCKRAVDEFLAAHAEFSVVAVRRSITIKKAS